MSRAHRHLGTREPTAPSLPARRPAETGTLVVGAAVFLAGRIWGWDAEVQGAVGVLVAALPAGVTFAVERWRGRTVS
jgi:hypothetical protein